MPTPRKPTSILEASGSYRKDPQRARARENEPQVTDPIGGYPLSFMASGAFDGGDRPRLRGLWDELIADAAEGVLNRSHRFHLEATCRLMVTVRYGRPKTGDYANLNKFLTQMGMNPAAQSTVSGKGRAPDEEDSVFSRLSQKSRARA